MRVQVCYCSKHRPQPQPDREPQGQLPAADPLLTAALLRASVFSATAEASLAVAGSSRTLPFDHTLHRGLRAPEAVAASLAKRNFLRALPYKVGHIHYDPPPPPFHLSASLRGRPSLSRQTDVSKALPSKVGCILTLNYLPPFCKLPRLSQLLMRSAIFSSPAFQW